MPHWKLHYHVIWATRERLPLLTPDIEQAVHKYLAQKCLHRGGFYHAINGMPDHVHLVVSIPPRQAIADFIGALKGSSSHFITREFNVPFSWEEGYGVFTINTRLLPKAIEYVQNQKMHHRDKTIIRVLEHTSADDEGPSPPSNSSPL